MSHISTQNKVALCDFVTHIYKLAAIFMRLISKILLWTLLTFATLIVLVIAGFFVHKHFFYYREMEAIKSDLNKMENVRVINIWGHEDITLEEVSARVKIANKGEIVLNNLNEGDFGYPDYVSITEIGGYSFTHFSGNGGIGPSIDIGTNGELGKMIGKKFYSVKEVIDNYDIILRTIQGLKTSSEINYFEDENSESYLLIERKDSKDQDPIFNLVGIDNKFEFAKTLTWKRKDSWYNENK